MRVGIALTGELDALSNLLADLLWDMPSAIAFVSFGVYSGECVSAESPLWRRA